MTRRSLSMILLSYLFVFGILNCAFGEDAKPESDTPQPTPATLEGMTAEQMEAMRSKAPKQNFQTEVDRMMKLIINSLYKNKEIFLRELISNSADALDKIRFLGLTDKKYASSEDLGVYVKADKESKTLIVKDNGIGMTEDELSRNLGTIAKSGTSDFLEKISKDGKDSSATNDMIGRFGVGFYSAFLVADRVTVVSKAVGSDQHIWESDAQSFSISKDPRGNTMEHGTEIVLHLKPESEDFLKESTIKQLVQKYSQFINFPINLWESHEETIDAPKKESEDKDGAVDDDEEQKQVKKTVWDWKRVNENKPVWTKKPSEVTDEEYNQFYSAMTGDSEKPLGKIHFDAEGEVRFKGLLFIPAKAPSNLYSLPADSALKSIKLYVRRVFITDRFEDMLPKFLDFIKGLIDSDDLPLNVSREELQQSKLLKIIKKKIIRKIIEMIAKIPELEYGKFWSEYGLAIKLGITEDDSNRARLAKLIRFHTSKNESGLVSLDQYLERKPESQKDIYFMTAAKMEDAKTSPFIERFLKKNIEVIYFVDAIDEYMIGSLKEYKGAQLVNIVKDGVQIDSSEAFKATKEAQDKDFEGLLKWFKEDALKDKIEKAQISTVLTTSPCALLTPTYGWSGNMERVMKAQALKRADDSMRFYVGQKRTLDINPRHPIIKELKVRVEADPADSRAHDTAALLFDTAALRSGFSVSDTIDFANRIEMVMRKSLDVDLNAKADEITDDDPIGEGEEEGSDASSEEPATTDTPTEAAKDEL